MLRTAFLGIAIILALLASPALTNQGAYAASLTKYTISESGVVTIAGAKHIVSLLIVGTFRASEKLDNTANGSVNVDNINYKVASATTKLDSTGKKISISIKLVNKGGVSASIVFPNKVDISKSGNFSTKQGSLVALIGGSTYNIKSISSGGILLEKVESNISKINSFSILGSSGDDDYTASFQLLDRNQSPTNADGKIGLAIKDSKDRVLYQSETAVNKGDFQMYQYTFTSAQFLAYSWTIPTAEVAPGFGYFGTAELTFTDSTGVSIKSTYDLVSIPKLSDEEIQRMSEDAYQKSSIPIGKTIEDNGFRIVVERIGYFTLDYFGEDKKLFRVDLSITNTGTEANYSPYEYVILDGSGNQYDKDFHGTMGFVKIYPGVTTKGYQTFDPMKEGSRGLKLVISRYSYPHDSMWEVAIPSKST